MNHDHTIYLLRQRADALLAQAAELSRTADTIAALPSPPSAHVIEIAQILHKHGLCVVERSALQLAQRCMVAVRMSDLDDGDEDSISTDQFAQAQEVVDKAILCSYPPMKAAPALALERAP